MPYPARPTPPARKATWRPNAAGAQPKAGALLRRLPAAPKRAGFVGVGSAPAPVAVAAPTAAPEPQAVAPADVAAPAMPFDPAVEKLIGENRSAEAVRQVAFGQRQVSIRQRYGQGADGKLNFLDPTDPYSKASVLMTRFREMQSGQTQSQFGRGMGFDGSSEGQDYVLARTRGQEQQGMLNDVNDEVLGVQNQAIASRDASTYTINELLAGLARRHTSDGTAQ